MKSLITLHLLKGIAGPFPVFHVHLFPLFSPFTVEWGSFREPPAEVQSSLPLSSGFHLGHKPDDVCENAAAY